MKIESPRVTKELKDTQKLHKVHCIQEINFQEADKKSPGYKKVLLRERKMHTARRVASARYAALFPDKGVPHPVLGRGTPGYTPILTWGYPLPHLDLGWGTPLHLLDLGWDYRPPPPPPILTWEEGNPFWPDGVPPWMWTDRRL